jgi:cytosine/adenosine deaminase-related metal-dependent hydrolase
MGYPLQQIENFLSAGVKVGLGFDSIALSGNADMFRTMKMVQAGIPQMTPELR